MFSLHRYRGLGLLLGGLVLLSQFVATTQAASDLSIDVAFRCLWWSEQQMEGMNPNSPPAKETEVTIERWEYTDPIGTPHPDVVDAVMTLTNNSTSPMKVTAEVSGQWLIGPMTSVEKAEWSQPQALQDVESFSVAKGQPVEFRSSFDVASRIAALEGENSWPWRFRLTVVLRTDGSHKPVLTRQVDLPINPGD